MSHFPAISYPIAFILAVIVVCATYLFDRRRINGISWKKGVLAVDSNNTDESALTLLDQTLDIAEVNHVRRLLSGAFQVFENNPVGERHAVYIAAINHCMKDIAAIGLDNYIENIQHMGRWSEQETQAFVKCLILSCSELVATRLDAYLNAKNFFTTDNFKKVLLQKIDKNIKYKFLLDTYIEDKHLLSAVISSTRAILKELPPDIPKD